MIAHGDFGRPPGSGVRHQVPSSVSLRPGDFNFQASRAIAPTIKPPHTAGMAIKVAPPAVAAKEATRRADSIEKKLMIPRRASAEIH